MSEPSTGTTSTKKKNSTEQSEGKIEHTCACGETHEHVPGVSHREECTSPQKFGDSCCCGSGQTSKARTPCGHSPRCH